MRENKRKLKKNHKINPKLKVVYLIKQYYNKNRKEGKNEQERNRKI